MTDSNPLDPNEGGMDAINALIEQAKQMQEQLQEAQARIAETVLQGTVGGGAVTVTVNGMGELIKVDIKEGGFDADSAEDLADLADLIVAAYRDAKTQADALANQTIRPLADIFPKPAS